MTQHELAATLRGIFNDGVDTGRHLGSGSDYGDIAKVLTAWEMLTRERDVARAEIYGIQEAHGTGNLALLEQAIQESHQNFPHVMTPALRFVFDMREALREPTEEAQRS